MTVSPEAKAIAIGRMFVDELAALYNQSPELFTVYGDRVRVVLSAEELESVRREPLCELPQITNRERVAYIDRRNRIEVVDEDWITVFHKEYSVCEFAGDRRTRQCYKAVQRANSDAARERMNAIMEAALSDLRSLVKNPDRQAER